jgi:hypothetical protein
MSKISSEFILGSAIGYFFSNNFLVFTLGIATGVVIQEKFGSVYKFSEFCYDSSKDVLKQQYSKLTSKWKKPNTNNSINFSSINNILDEIKDDLNNDNLEMNKNGNSLKNKED